MIATDALSLLLEIINQESGAPESYE